MTDMILAQFQGTTWLVVGTEHLDDLLANTLSPAVTFEIVPCASAKDVDALWRYHAGDAADGAQPWAIHPNIVRRLQGLGTDYAVVFTAWSALLDDAAQQVVARVAQAAKARPEEPLRLVGQADPGGGPMPSAMLQMRQQLIEDALTAAGIDRARLLRVSRGPDDAGYSGELAEIIGIHIGG
jgi:hypothetical protein